MKDSTNIGVANAKAEASVGDYFKRLLARVTGPMPIVGGSALPSREGMPGKPLMGVNADKELLEKTAHVRKPKECMMEFFSRIPACGAHFIRNHSKEEIKRLVEVVMANPDYEERERVVAPMFEPKPPKTRFILT